MKEASAFVRRLALASLVIFTSILPVSGGQTSSEGEGHSISAESTKPASSELTQWTECDARIQADADRLCERAAVSMALPAFDIVNDVLRAGTSSWNTLCAVDAAIVKSQECVAGQGATDVGLLAALMRELAASWQQLGKLRRADQLYERIEVLDNMSAADGRGIVGLISTLQHWALLKLEMKETDRARELSQRQVALARKAFESARFSPLALGEALTIHAKILLELGYTDEARALEREAAAVSVRPPGCDGIFCTRRSGKAKSCNKIHIDKSLGPLCLD